MADQQTIPPTLAEAVRPFQGRDIVVGMPTYNNAATIATTLQAVRYAVHQLLPGKRALIVHTDGGSTDGTAQRALEQNDDTVPLVQMALDTPPDLVMPYHGIPGKEAGLRRTLQVSRAVGARACLMIGPDFVELPPDWVVRLVSPILDDGFDFVVPLYVRHRFDGAIISSIVRPLLRALYGKKMRQPMAAEYAFSSRLAERYLAQNHWETDLGRLGTDIWTVTQAMSGSFKLCQMRLGMKIQPASPPPTDVGTTLSQVLGSLFEDMSRNAPAWQRVRSSQPVPIAGDAMDVATTGATFDSRKLAESFRIGLRNLHDVWALVLPPATLLALQRVAAGTHETFALPDQAWCRALYDFSLGYRLRTINRSHLLAAFLPLYMGWLASFVREMQDASDEDSERRIEQLCQVYELEKPYLISRWRWPDRFNP